MYPQDRRLRADRGKVRLIEVFRRERIVHTLCSRRNIRPVGRWGKITRVVPWSHLCQEKRTDVNLLTVGRGAERRLEIEGVHHSTRRERLIATVSLCYALCRLRVRRAATTASCIGPDRCAIRFCPPKAKW